MRVCLGLLYASTPSSNQCSGKYRRVHVRECVFSAADDDVSTVSSVPVIEDGTDFRRIPRASMSMVPDKMLVLSSGRKGTAHRRASSMDAHAAQGDILPFPCLNTLVGDSLPFPCLIVHAGQGDCRPYPWLIVHVISTHVSCLPLLHSVFFCLRDVMAIVALG